MLNKRFLPFSLLPMHPHKLIPEIKLLVLKMLWYCSVFLSLALCFPLFSQRRNSQPRGEKEAKELCLFLHAGLKDTMEPGSVLCPAAGLSCSSPPSLPSQWRRKGAGEEQAAKPREQQPQGRKLVRASCSQARYQPCRGQIWPVGCMLGTPGLHLPF